MNERASGRTAVRPEERIDAEDEEQTENEKPEEERAEGEEPGAIQGGGGEGGPGRKEKEEGRKLRSIGDPRLPSPREVEEHNLTHLPYRNWCPQCVRGRGQDLDHRK